MARFVTTISQEGLHHFSTNNVIFSTPLNHLTINLLLLCKMFFRNCRLWRCFIKNIWHAPVFFFFKWSNRANLFTSGLRNYIVRPKSDKYHAWIVCLDCDKINSELCALSQTKSLHVFTVFYCNNHPQNYLWILSNLCRVEFH